MTRKKIAFEKTSEKMFISVQCDKNDPNISYRNTFYS